jgi:hypothetical protein
MAESEDTDIRKDVYAFIKAQRALRGTETVQGLRRDGSHVLVGEMKPLTSRRESAKGSKPLK